MKNLEKYIRELEKEDGQAVKDERPHDMDAARRMLVLLKEWNGREDEKEVSDASSQN